VPLDCNAPEPTAILIELIVLIYNSPSTNGLEL